ncbi:MAG: tetratricopeptide repeat protein [Pseudomonadota bacterium]
MNRLLARLLLVCSLPLAAPPVSARVAIDHPDPAAFSAGVGERLGEARTAFDARVEAGGATGADYGQLGMVYQAHDQEIPAGQAYRNAVELAPADARWPYYLGMIEAGAGNFAAAAALFGDSVARNPEYVPAKIRQARAQVEAGELESARVLLEELVEAFPRAAVVHADLGLLAASDGRPEEAVVRLEEALQLQPGASKLHYPLALAYRALGDVEKARSHLEQQGAQEVVFDDPLLNRMRSLSGSFAYFMSLGLAAARERNFEVARDFMLQAVAADPARAEPRVNLARMYEALGNSQRGIEELDGVLADHPGNPLAHFNRGAMYEVIGEESRAATDYRAAIAAQVDMFDAHLMLASNRMRAKDWSEAARGYRKALELRPGRAELLLYQATALQAAGRCQEAVGVLLELVRRLPEEFATLIAYARVAATCPEASDEDRGNALNAARNMYRLDPSFEVTATLAMAEAAVGNFEAALDFNAQAGFMAAREGIDNAIELLRENGQRFEAGEPAAVPWGPAFGYLNPRPLTREDRQ